MLATFGSGKTLRCVEEAILAAQSGREVFMNFALKSQLGVDYPDLAPKIHHLTDFYGFLEQREIEHRQGKIFKEFEALFLVDEAHEIWNSRRSMTGLQIASRDYIFISRKLGLELHMATQLASNLDRSAKLLVQVWVVCSKFIDSQGEIYFKFERYSPEIGTLPPTFFTPSVAAQFYPYYEMTGATTIGPVTPLELEEAEPQRPVTYQQFNRFKEHTTEVMRDLKKELGAIRKDVRVQLRKDESNQKTLIRMMKKAEGRGRTKKGRYIKKVGKVKRKRY